MTPFPPDPQDARLSQVLQSWQIPAGVPPTFAQSVWRRIADGAAPASVALTTLLAGWLVSRLRQPRFVAAYLLLIIVGGMGTGLWRGREGSENLAAGLRGMYVQSIDPYASGQR